MDPIAQPLYLPATFTQTWSMQGPLVTKVGTLPWYAFEDTTILEVRASVGTSPDGLSIICDLRKNGTSVFPTHPSRRPTIEPGAHTALSGRPEVEALTDGDYLTVDIVQVGSGNPGADLSVEVLFSR